MSKMMPVTLLVALATITVSAPLAAQGRSTANSAVLDAAVASRPADSRAALTATLMSKEGIAEAGKLGVSPDELSARIAALDDATAQQLSDQYLAGGSSNVVIGTTALIIILLVVIILVVA